MAGKRTKPSVLRKIKNYFSRPGMFSRMLVLFCIGYCVRICEWAMWQFEQSNSEASTLLSAGLALFGGELLMLVIKRVFTKRDKSEEAPKEPEPKNNDENYGL